MILSFGNRETQALFKREASRRFDARIHRVALRKLLMIDAAEVLEDLKSPPGNRLEALRGNLKGKYSIRINDQWRVVFSWNAGHARDVAIVDYH